MSLINDMLRDLDTRSAASSERDGLARNVRALPAAPAQRRLHPILLALGAALLGGGGVWLMLKPPAPTVQAATVAPPAAPIAPSAEAPLALPAEPSPMAEPAAAEPPTLRLDTTISTPPAKTEPAVAAASPSAIAPPTNSPVVRPAPQTLALAAVPKPIAATAAAPAPRSNTAPHISKQPTDASTANEHAESEYRRGTAAIRRGDIVEGGDALRSALRIAPTHAPARQALLALLMEQQRWADAETLALDGVGLMPQRSDWALLAARLMYERGEAAAALTLLDQYAGNARQNADYQVMRALLLQRANRNADAADCYQAALAIRPQEGRWWYGLGLALDADHREALARQAYEKARESNNLPAELRQAVERRLR